MLIVDRSLIEMDMHEETRPKRSDRFLLKTKTGYREPNDLLTDIDDLHLMNERWKTDKGIVSYKPFIERGYWIDIELVTFYGKKTLSKVQKLFPSRDVLSLRRNEFEGR